MKRKNRRKKPVVQAEDVIYEGHDAWYPDYALKVIRFDANKGVLTVSFKGEVFYQEYVPLDNGAQFGPSIDNCHYWGSVAVCLTDKHRVDHEGEYTKSEKCPQ